ncbi:LysR family transcriptional regulator [Sphingomonas morindae]|uniref:LysR family transcriptional regulator n=1 Tax=Sphingomonas morindae TaxID=1541170 RepID=A0ABY4XAG9_9SPHN|nr:LysR family transcriptional regulator [Sphingomonas morindae]USI73929.1 LysR family transcriptional regulator [Sphingomonas morindae]
MANSDFGLNLDDLGIFLAVIEARGFRAASKQLGLSPSTVSERIAETERRLGVTLLSRTTRSVTPTEAGWALAGRLKPLFAEARSALQDAATTKTEVRGLLRLHATGAVMVDILPPLLDRLLSAHPHMRVEVVVEDRLVDIVAAGCDAGIRHGEHLAKDMTSVAIGPPTQALAYAASPAYLAPHEWIREPRELLDHEAIRLRFSSGALVQWEFERDADLVTIDPPGRLIIGVDAAASAIAAACADHGIIGTFENWLRPHFDAGALVPVLQEWWPTFEGPRLYFPRRVVAAPLRALISLVEKEQGSGDSSQASDRRSGRRADTPRSGRPRRRRRRQRLSAPSSWTRIRRRPSVSILNCYDSRITRCSKLDGERMSSSAAAIS